MRLNVHPVVILQILDHYSRRNENQRRVIGTLLGSEQTDSQLHVKDTFPVPHTETDAQIQFDLDYHRTMLELHQKVNNKEQILGWYTTGSNLTENDHLLHEFYSSKGKSGVIILVVDVSASTNKLKAFRSTSLVLGSGDVMLGAKFEQIPVVYAASTQEKIAIEALRPDSAAIAYNEISHVESTLQKVHKMIDDIQQYISKVIEGKVKGDKTTAKLLNEALSGINQITANTTEKAYNDSLQDNLMALYLSNLVAQQLILAEKITM
jgi:translation initiation factor 3 subunit F